MIPNNAISYPLVWAPYLSPDDIAPYDPLVSWQEGGIGLSDASQGLQVQPWKLEALGTPLPSDMYISAPNTPATPLLSDTYIQSCSLAFDQNMKPAIGYMAADRAKLWWYDATVPGYTTLLLDPDITSVQVTLDDKRVLASTTNESDIVLVYTKGSNLYFRRQRDRFLIEYVLVLGLSIPAPRMVKVGMNEGTRLQFYLSGSIYQ